MSEELPTVPHDASGLGTAIAVATMRVQVQSLGKALDELKGDIRVEMRAGHLDLGARMEANRLEIRNTLMESQRKWEDNARADRDQFVKALEAQSQNFTKLMEIDRAQVITERGENKENTRRTTMLMTGVVIVAALAPLLLQLWLKKP